MQVRPPTARPRPRPTARGRPAVARASPQGATAHKGDACGHGGLWPVRRGSNRWQRGARKWVDRPFAGRLPTGKGIYRLRRGNGGGGEEGARGKLGFPFY
ncbi:hypothetical protein B296_00053217 [Ensete ventricosum]|uniref:Uncharacterized protein n=1 Tax=Ensete ventricosum TaxID=4639 RepID=A0A426WWF6_ENSVE|nr:hypothetical protein B296_00053217 [Ensete ventricosum]